MSPGAVWSGGVVLSPPGRRCKRSAIHYKPRRNSSSGSRVEPANCPSQRASGLSLRVPTEYRHGSLCQLPKLSLSSVAKFQVCCAERPDGQLTSDGGDDLGVKADLRMPGLVRVAALIGSATVLSKILGLVRESVLAAVFGVGPVINAFSYSSIIPGFFLTILGGINGPFHTAVASSLSKLPKEEGRNLLQRLTIITGTVFGAMSIAIFTSAAPLVDTLAPGLVVPGHTEGLLTRNLAIIQLKIMAPCTMLAALIGIGFGTLSTAGVYGVPSLSPALSSISVLVAVSIYVLRSQQSTPIFGDTTAGAVHLAAGATIGALAQWYVQVLAQQRAGFKPFKAVLGKHSNPFMDENIRQVFAVLLPAAITSGLLQIATYTDLHFASFIPGAAAALGYANLLAMAPLGILSSSILVPMLPMFSRLSKPSHVLELQERVRQGLLLSMALTLLMTALVVPLARPLVRVVFQRHAFDSSASRLVSSLLVCYVFGSTFYLARDLLVHVFYALGDGHTPFQISMAAIFANALLDWLFIHHAGFGVQGLVAATSLVNGGSALVLALKLSSKFQGLQLQYWIRPLLVLGCSATIAGILTKFSYNLLSVQFLSSVIGQSRRCMWAMDFLSIFLATAAGVITYFMPLFLFQAPEVKSVIRLLHAKT